MAGGDQATVLKVLHCTCGAQSHSQVWNASSENLVLKPTLPIYLAVFIKFYHHHCHHTVQAAITGSGYALGAIHGNRPPVHIAGSQRVCVCVCVCVCACVRVCVCVCVCV